MDETTLGLDDEPEVFISTHPDEDPEDEQVTTIVPEIYSTSEIIDATTLVPPIEGGEEPRLLFDKDETTIESVELTTESQTTQSADDEEVIIETTTIAGRVHCI